MQKIKDSARLFKQKLTNKLKGIEKKESELNSEERIIEYSLK